MIVELNVFVVFFNLLVEVVVFSKDDRFEPVHGVTVAEVGDKENMSYFFVKA